MYNMYTEEEEDETGGLALGQPSLENSITMNKMKLLKAKMEDMNINKKVDGFYFLVLSLGCHYSLSINTVRIEENGHLYYPNNFIGQVLNGNLNLQNASPGGDSVIYESTCISNNYSFSYQNE